MILKVTETDGYSFVSGSGNNESLKSNEFLLRNNNIENQYEIWIKCDPGFEGLFAHDGPVGTLIWCRKERSVWLAFDRVASKAEIDEYHTF